MMFYSPKDADSLKKLLGDDLENTYIIGAGTDLIISLRNKKITDYSIIDITKLSEFKGIWEDDEYVYIGALTTMTEIAESELIHKELRALREAAFNLGSEIIRNKATIGGNIANAAQCADTVLALFSYNANIVLLGPEKERTIPIDELVIGRNQTTIASNEIIAKIVVEKKNRISAFQKLGSRKAVTISKISCAADLLMKEGLIDKVNIFLGAVGVRPVRAELLEAEFKGKAIDEIELETIQKLAYDEIELAIPDRSSKYYKRIAIQSLMKDLLKDLIKND